MTTATTEPQTEVKKKRKARAVFLVGATGAGKSSQISTLLKSTDLKVVVICYDPGSSNAHGVTDIIQADPSLSIREFLEKYPDDKYLRVIDSWPGYETDRIARFATAKKRRPTLKEWGDLVGGWRDDIVLIYSSFNVVLVGNLSDGARKVSALDSEGKQCQTLLPAGQLVCSPALASPPVLAQMAPIVICMTSGGEKRPRGFVQGNFGQIATKFVYRPQGEKEQIYTLPGGTNADRIVPVDVCDLHAIIEALRS